MRTWYKFTAKSEDLAELSIFEEIGMWGVSAKHFIADLKKVSAKKISLSINSPGGSVFDALAIFNALRMSGKEIEVTVLGIAASAASYIMLAGDKITMPENAMVMVHNPMGGLFGNADEHRELADVLDKVGANLQATYAKRTGMEPEAVAELLSKDTFLTAAECLELGLCDEVTAAVEVKASYDTENLPENVKALFKAAQEPQPEPEPEPAAFGAEALQDLMDNAGLGEFSAAWGFGEGAITSADAATAAIAVAKEARALCALAKKPELANEFIKARKSIADVRAALNAALVAKDESTDPPEPKDIKNPSPDPKAQSFSPTAYWANR